MVKMRRLAMKKRDDTPRRTREDDVVFVQTDDEDSIASFGSAGSSKSHKSRKSKGGHWDERVGIEALGTNAFTYLNPSQSSKFLRTKKRIAEHAAMVVGSEQFELIMDGVEPENKPPVISQESSTTCSRISSWKSARYSASGTTALICSINRTET